MIGKIQDLLRKLYIVRLCKRGLVLGKNVKVEKGVNIDANFPWLIEIGDNVVLSPWVYILSHDSAYKRLTGYMRIGKVKIEDEVFIGAKATILPGVTVGRGSIVGTNCVVTKDVPPYSIVIGIPGRVISSIDEGMKKQQRIIEESIIYDRSYTIWGGCTAEKKHKMQDDLSRTPAYILTDKN